MARVAKINGAIINCHNTRATRFKHISAKRFCLFHQEYDPNGRAVSCYILCATRRLCLFLCRIVHLLHWFSPHFPSIYNPLIRQHFHFAMWFFVLLGVWLGRTSQRRQHYFGAFCALYKCRFQLRRFPIYADRLVGWSSRVDLWSSGLISMVDAIQIWRNG